jgi:phosphatidylserine/phosphatidylglycerophosphate/cardiolipin synthase-like enzyme
MNRQVVKDNTKCTSLLICLLFLSNHWLLAQNTWFKQYHLSQIKPNNLEIEWFAPSANFDRVHIQTLGNSAKSEQRTIAIQPESTHHFSLNINDLTPATCYEMRLESDPLNPIIVSTASLSSGEIKVFFNQSISTNVGLVNNFPDGTTATACLDALINLINNAKLSIDVAMYNTNYTSLVNALKAAKGRGLQVRYIADADQSNNGLSPNPNFPVFRATGNQNGIMHNKFMIIDANSSNPLDTWVTSGSMNWTSGQILTDPNQLILIQDQSLAKAYQMEFEEMWGSNGPNYNAATARFGEFKTNNTPHQFNIGGVMVESFFSPSDNPHTEILKAIESGQSSVEFGLLLITKDDVASKMVAKHQSGVKVRGIINDDSSLGNPYYTMKNNGVPILVHTPATIFHHKYAIVDADLPSSDPLVLTGSHNWTYSAHTINDENTLIIHSELIADLYRKEFAKRWLELMPSDLANVADVVLKVYPNPVSDVLSVVLPDNMQIARVDIISALGQRMVTTQGQRSGRVEVEVLDLPKGNYSLICTNSDGRTFHFPFLRF